MEQDAMKRILVISGSRADFGLLEMPVKALREAGFNVSFYKIWDRGFDKPDDMFPFGPAPDLVMLLGDRHEILHAALEAHLQRIPIAHIAGGDVTKGSYDDAMRDCISRLATIHFPTSVQAELRLIGDSYENIHMIGNLALDYIKHGDWDTLWEYDKPYIVISYQPETLADDPVKTFRDLLPSLPKDINRYYILPNPDRGSDEVEALIRDIALPDDVIVGNLPRAAWLKLLKNCDEFIGNSSSLLYEAPFLGIKTRLVGNRQEGRVIPEGDGNSSQRIVEVLKNASF